MRTLLFLSFILISPLNAMKIKKKNKPVSSASYLKEEKKSNKNTSKSWYPKITEIKEKLFPTKEISNNDDPYDADTEYPYANTDIFK